MALNLSKSNFLKFNIYNKSDNSIMNCKLTIHDNLLCQKLGACNCTEIKELSQIKYLGLIYDNKSNWKFNTY